MKKLIVWTLSVILVLASLACFARAEAEPKFVTIREWLDAPLQARRNRRM